ncbi:MAG TPA: pyridoxamine 5'-phosphate oxidase family protein [Thermoanaerobaculia bacterium]|jgi:general stress protein 26|nr:pyridoxamine 5'-phosphate oxidase family protein [Thermoanaerobaculia bacterium]
MASKKEKLAELYKLIGDIETAMFTTRRGDGLLVSRPMATQAQAEGADLWFVTDRNSPKVDELRNDPNINLSYYHPRTKEWISVSGTAKPLRSEKKIRELWRPDWRGWFGDEGGPKDGTPEDPRIILIAVTIRLAVYLELNKPQPVILFELLKGMITGKRPDLPQPKAILKKAGGKRRAASRNT